MNTNDPILEVVRLWNGAAPGAIGNESKDVPDLTVYPSRAEVATGAAMIICPGGSYMKLAPHEGEGYARYLSERGITCFVLRYRLGSNGYRYEAILGDVKRAVRLVRASAKRWKIDPGRIGVMGSSAGGHLTSQAVTRFDAGDAHAVDPIERQSSRPDIGVLCYPAILMGEGGHAGCRQNLLGDSPTVEQLKQASSEQNVTPQTPPCFRWHTWEDKSVPISHSLEFAEALQRASVPFDLHIYQIGGHGMGLGNKAGDTPIHPWAEALVHWLKVQRFVN